MRKHILTLALGVAAILVTAQAMKAQGRANCGDRVEIGEQLAATYGETRQAIGLAGGSQVVEVFASLETGTWTILVTRATGIACMVAAGRGFERLDEDLTPAMLGVPA